MADKRPYSRYAFHNLYNYTLMGAVAVVSIVSGAWLPLAVGAGLEALWMLNAPGSRLLQKAWFDKVHAEKERAARAGRRQAALAAFQPEDAQRVAELQAKQEQINKLAQENPQFTAELLAAELKKLDTLVDGFIDLAQNATRYQEYLGTVDFEALAAELVRYGNASEHEPDPQLRTTAKKNLSVLMSRQEKLADLSKYVAGAKAQLDLIENTFRLIGDQILTMRSPQELGGQLNDLLDGVEAIRSTAAEREQMLAQPA